MTVPAPAKLVINGTNSASRQRLARRMADNIAAVLPGRAIHVMADSAHVGSELKGFTPAITWTTRLRKDAALFARRRPAPARGGVPAVEGHGR